MPEAYFARVLQTYKTPVLINATFSRGCFVEPSSGPRPNRFSRFWLPCFSQIQWEQWLGSAHGGKTPFVPRVDIEKTSFPVRVDGFHEAQATGI